MHFSECFQLICFDALPFCDLVLEPPCIGIIKTAHKTPSKSFTTFLFSCTHFYYYRFALFCSARWLAVGTVIMKEDKRTHWSVLWTWASDVGLVRKITVVVWPRSSISSLVFTVWLYLELNYRSQQFMHVPNEYHAGLLYIFLIASSQRNTEHVQD